MLTNSPSLPRPSSHYGIQIWRASSWRVLQACTNTVAYKIHGRKHRAAAGLAAGSREIVGIINCKAWYKEKGGGKKGPP